MSRTGTRAVRVTIRSKNVRPAVLAGLVHEAGDVDH